MSTEDTLAAPPYWQKYWGKADRKTPLESYHLLVCHCMDVAAMAQVFLDKNPHILERLAPRVNSTPQALKRLLVFLIALHDIGKFEESFQNLVPELFELLQGKKSSKPYNVRHDAMGFVAWDKVLANAYENSPELFAFINSLPSSHRKRSPWFAALLHGIFGHHGKPVDVLNSVDQAPYFRNKQTKRDVLSFWHDMIALLYPPSQQPSHTELFHFTSPQESTLVLQHIKAISWTLAGLYVLCDWTGSDSSAFTFHKHIHSIEDYWHNHALPTAKKSVEKRTLITPKHAAHTAFEDLFPHLASYTPRPLQQQAIATHITPDVPQLFILEDETGSGKTEAALMLAKKLQEAELGQGIYIALPTMATSNAMYERLATTYQNFFAPEETPSLILAHGQRLLSSTYQKALNLFEEAMRAKTSPGHTTYTSQGASTPDSTAEAVCAEFFAHHRHLALFADVGVGTVDQALLAVLPSKHQSLRLFALGQKILIIDEVHAYDAYTNTLVCNLLKHHAAQGGSAILLSATLPSTTRQKLTEAFQEGALYTSQKTLTNNTLEHQTPPTDYPLLSHITPTHTDNYPVKLSSQPRQTRCAFFHSDEDTLGWIKAQLREGRCVCWIRNTVADAVAMARELKNDPDINTDDILLFHARMTMEDRLRVEEQVLNLFGKHSTASDRKGKLVISTQVIEQSLDVDFDEMVSDLTTMDLLIQRLGRYRRHARDIHGNLLESQQDLNADLRGERIFHVLAPTWSDEPQENWYADLFSRAAYVYPRHDQLWRTMRCLLSDDHQHGRVIELPTESRNLVEEVFAEDGDIPEGLENTSYEAIIEEDVEYGQALRNSLKLEDGYGVKPDTFKVWLPETQTPTRLGEPSSTLRLLKKTSTGLEPWASRKQPHPWPRSDVRILTKYAAEEDINSAHKKALTRLKNNNMSDKCRYTLCVILEPHPTTPDLWVGQVLNPHKETTTLHYSETYGLEIAENV